MKCLKRGWFGLVWFWVEQYRHSDIWATTDGTMDDQIRNSNFRRHSGTNICCGKVGDFQLWWIVNFWIWNDCGKYVTFDMCDVMNCDITIDTYVLVMLLCLNRNYDKLDSRSLPLSQTLVTMFSLTCNLLPQIVCWHAQTNLSHRWLAPSPHHCTI